MEEHEGPEKVKPLPHYHCVVCRHDYGTGSDAEENATICSNLQEAQHAYKEGDILILRPRFFELRKGQTRTIDDPKPINNTITYPTKEEKVKIVIKLQKPVYRRVVGENIKTVQESKILPGGLIVEQVDHVPDGHIPVYMIKFLDDSVFVDSKKRDHKIYFREDELHPA